MNKPYITEFKAVDPKDGTLKTWAGPTIWKKSWEHAQKWCEENQGHLLVIGELIAEIPADENLNPIWDKMIDYEMYHLKGEHKTDNKNETIHDNN